MTGQWRRLLSFIDAGKSIACRRFPRFLLACWIRRCSSSAVRLFLLLCLLLSRSFHSSASVRSLFSAYRSLSRSCIRAALACVVIDPMLCYLLKPVFCSPPPQSSQSLPPFLALRCRPSSLPLRWYLINHKKLSFALSCLINDDISPSVSGESFHSAGESKELIL